MSRINFQQMESMVDYEAAWATGARNAALHFAADTDGVSAGTHY